MDALAQLSSALAGRYGIERAREEVDERLKHIILGIHETCVKHPA